MTNSLEQFNKEVEDFAKKIPTKVSEYQKKIVLEAVKRIVEKTPVDTGNARLNWHVTIGKKSNKVLEDISLVDTGKETLDEAPSVDEVGSDVITNALSAISNLSPFQVIYISNNVEYIEFLEEGRPGPGSPQAPKGMVAITVEELKEMFNDVRAGS